MTSIRVNSSSLLKWARYMNDEAPRRSKAAMARALNTFGDNMMGAVSRQLAASTGLSEATVSSLLVVKKASPNNLQLQIDTSEVRRRAQDRMSNDPFDIDRGDFSDDELVNVKTADDEKVCMECNDIALHNPYPYATARALIPHHPNCRCTLAPWQTTRRKVAVRVGTGATEMLTVNQLGQAIADEMRIILKAAG